MSARRVLVVAYPDIQALDLVGPVEVFAAANRVGGAHHYDLAVVSIDGRPVRSMSGLAIGVDHRLRPCRARSTR